MSSIDVVCTKQSYQLDGFPEVHIPFFSKEGPVFSPVPYDTSQLLCMPRSFLPPLPSSDDVTRVVIPTKISSLYTLLHLNEI